MEKSSARWWDLPSAAFLFLAILFSSWRLQSTDWTDGLEHVRNVALLGMFVGLALGASIYQKRAVILLTLCYTLVIFIWQLLGTIEISDRAIYLGDRLLILAGRLWLGLQEFFSNRPVKDPLLFISLLFILYWFSSVFGGYQMARYANGLAAVLPSGVLMFAITIIQYTGQETNWLFAAYLFATFLFLGRQKYLVDRKKWGEQRIQTSAESGLDFNNTIMLCTGIAILLVWLLPFSLSYNAQARESWNERSKKWYENKRWENMLAAVKKEPIPASDFYQDTLPLGTQVSQSAAIKFLVFVPAGALELPRLYWRGRVYDRFEDGRWLIKDVKSINFKPLDGDFEIPGTRNAIDLEFTFNVYQEGQAILYTASQPLWVDHPAHIIYKKIPAQSENQTVREDLNQTLDIVNLQATPYLKAGETYNADALIANPAISELREAGNEYPAWVTEEYLQLPSNFSSRIRALALRITENQDTPYDKALAITNYLRAEIQYKSSISFPKEPVDPLEYFLFDVKQGFCNYYASAETLMLRSIGIPARLAVGFAQGEANLQNSFYTVRNRDAHAWPEVYFPNFGWIEFEPTVNQPELERPEEPKETPAPTSIPLNDLETNNPVEESPEKEPLDGEQIQVYSRTRILQVGVIVGGFLLVLITAVLKKRYAPDLPVTVFIKSVLETNGWNTPDWFNNWIRWAEVTRIERYFQSINIGLNWMGKPQPVHTTPAERANILMELLPVATSSIQILLHEHQAALFTEHGGDPTLTRRAAWDILYQIITLRIKTFIFG